MGNLGNTILNEIKELEIEVNNGKKLDEKILKQLDAQINSIESTDNQLKHSLKDKLLKLRRKSLVSNKATKWDIFCADMIDIDGINPINELIDYINEIKDKTISKDELQSLEAKYSSVLPLIHEKLSDYDKDRAINEFNKKIKLFNNRLSRVIENDFGSWVKQIRLSKGLSLKELEILSGVTASYVHRLENGSRKTPSVPIVEKLAKGLGVSPDEFLRKLNLTSSNSTDRKIDLVELIAKSTFTIKGEAVNTEKKEALLNVMKMILDSEWSADTKFSDGMAVVNEVDKFRSKLNMENE